VLRWRDISTDILGTLKVMWFVMLGPPWRHTGADDERGGHWFLARLSLQWFLRIGGYQTHPRGHLKRLLA
jgi:hypothetical protein